MLAYVLVFCLCLNTCNGQNGANTVFSSSSMTDATCSNSGLWTIWFQINSTQSTQTGNNNDAYSALVRLANEICQTPSGAEIQISDNRLANAQTVLKLPSSSLFFRLLASYALFLNGRDFSVRYCCAVDSSDSTVVNPLRTPPQSTKTTTTAPNTPLTSLDGDTCGKQAIKPRSARALRISGGTNAIAYSWPWMLSFGQSIPCSSSTTQLCYVVCGATLISKNYAITAAHCISTAYISNITLTAGIYQDSSTTETSTRQRRSVAQVYLHPQYDRTSMSNDIAVLRVNTSFTYTTYVQAACLPRTDPRAGAQVVILGWGTEKSDGNVVDKLKQAYTTIIGNCNYYWPQVRNRLQICVANSASGDSICAGDSGGPILSEDNGQYIVSGVASYVHFCKTTGVDGVPNVFTRVSAHTAWIKSVAI